MWIFTFINGLKFCHSLQWRHNGHGSVSNHQPHDCLLNRLLRRRSKKTLKLRVTVLCAGNSPGTGEFPAQMASHAGNVSIWWRHHVWSHHMERHVVDGIGSDKTGRCWKIHENLSIIHESFRTIHLIFYLKITGFRNIYTQWWSNCTRRHGMVERYLYIYMCVWVCVYSIVDTLLFANNIFLCFFPAIAWSLLFNRQFMPSGFRILFNNLPCFQISLSPYFPDLT